jgi:hypothetical protein
MPKIPHQPYSLKISNIISIYIYVMLIFNKNKFFKKYIDNVDFLTNINLFLIILK